MRAGDLIAERFEIEALGGEGGLGVVYSAIDRQSGQRVALKLLKSQSPELAQRFEREVSALAELDHPAIVSYVTHGASADGRLYLVMDWLEGETLEQRLARQGLTVQESIGLVRRVAAALGQAHRRGIIHRDLKPANLFLVDKRLEGVRILDFGVARVKAHQSLTRTGIPVGTPSYMAPEQARGASEIDARADVFALGSVLFECLTGRQAFPGEHAVSVLVRVIFEPAPRVRELRPELPESIESLLAAMLAKNPALRLSDAEAVAHALDIVEDLGLPRPAPVATRPPVLTHSEQQLTSLVVIADDCAFDDRTLPEAEVATQSQLLESIADFYGARFEFALGAKMLIFSGHDAAVDQVARAARSALELSERLATPLALATGWAVLAGHMPVGEVLERALRLSVEARNERGVRIDEASAGLLAARFALSDDRRRLFHERSGDEASPLLLGQVTPCVGRERELRMLAAIARECAAGPIASAVLVTGAAGIGKTRLRDELLFQLQAAELGYEIWSARGDAMKRGLPCELLRSILRSAPPQRVSGAFAPLLEAGALDVQAMDSVRLAWLELLDAVTLARPLLLALDDLQLADAPSLALIDLALERLEERPLFVLALGRSELHRSFPRLWQERSLQEIRLPELARRAGEELVRAVLGSQATDELVTRLVEHAGGNAFVLEELIRAASQSSASGLPRSAVAVAQARLTRIEPDARRILKAASVFGTSFWPDAVGALIGADGAAALDKSLASLQAREFIRRDASSRFADHAQFSFRHSLLVEAAYALLTDDDRTVAHRLAGEWLEAAGDEHALALATHFDLGGAARRAIPWWQRAAEQALAANEFAAAIEHAARGITAGAHGQLLGELSVVLGEAARWAGDLERAESALREALALLAPGSRAWCNAAREQLVVFQRKGRRPEAEALCVELLEVSTSDDEAATALALARIRAAMAVSYLGAVEPARRLVEAVEHSSPESALGAPVVKAWIHRQRADEAARRGDFAVFLEQTELAILEFGTAGLERAAVTESVTAGYALLELGAYARAHARLAAAETRALRLGLAQSTAVARQNLAFVLLRLGRPGEALSTAESALQTFEALGERRMCGATRLYLALIHAARGDLALAEQTARSGLEALTRAAPPLVPEALATLSHVLLLAGRASEALEPAERAHDLLETSGAESGEGLIRVSFAEACLQTGMRERALAVLAAARDRLQERAASISDAELRAGFLRGVPEHARTLELCEALG
jgi:eukaryotic-like serine/threonine-protein kinase